MKHVPSSDEAIRMTDERKKQFDIFFSLASEEIERLAQALFNKQEQMLPNGDVWADLTRIMQRFDGYDEADGAIA